MPGVEIKYVKVGGGGDMLRAIAGNDVDFGGLGNPPTAIGITRGLPIKGIMVINMLDYVEAMVVRTSKNIKSFKDLKGKTVAAPFGSTTHYLLLQALKDDGVDPASMKILDLAPSDIAAAWVRGDIDAAWFWEPNLDKAVKNGGHIFMTSGLMAKRGYPTWDIGVVMNEFAAKYPDLCREVRQGRMRRHRLLAQESGQDRRDHRRGTVAAARRCDADDERNRMVPCDQQLDRPVSRHIEPRRPVRRYAGCDRRLPGQAGSVAEAAAARGLRGFHPAVLHRKAGRQMSVRGRFAGLALDRYPNDLHAFFMRIPAALQSDPYPSLDRTLLIGGRMGREASRDRRATAMRRDARGGCGALSAEGVGKADLDLVMRPDSSQPIRTATICCGRARSGTVSTSS